MFEINTNIINFWRDQYYKLFEKYPKNIWDINKKKIPLFKDKSKEFSILEFPFGEWFQNENIDPFDLCINRNIRKGLSNETAIYSVNSKEEKITNYSFLEIEIITKEIKNWLINNDLCHKDNLILIGDHGIEMAGLIFSASSLNILFSVCFKSIQSDELISRIEMLFPKALIFTNHPNLAQENLLNQIGIFKANVFQSKFFKKELIIYKRDPRKYKFKNNLDIDLKSSFFALFTSGSTGKPKGVIHSKAGYLLYAYYTSKYFWNLSAIDTMLCASDAGWINGHTYSLFGPLLCGSKTVLLDEPSCMARINFATKIIKESKTTCLYLPVALIRLKKSIGELEKPTSSIRAIGSMGEPLAPSLREWYAKSYLGNASKPVVNTYFQTETGGILCANRSSDNIVNSKKAIGKVPNFLSITNEFEEKESELIIKTPWPGSANYFLGNYDSIIKYLTKNGYYRLSDIGYIKEKYLYVNGRSDDTLIIQGKNVSSTYLESICLAIDNRIQEAVAFTMHDEMNNILLCLGLTLKVENNIKDLKRKVREKVYESTSSNFVVRRFYKSDNIPKSKSGKILRKNIRNQANILPVDYKENLKSFSGINPSDGTLFKFTLLK